MNGYGWLDARGPVVKYLQGAFRWRPSWGSDPEFGMQDVHTKEIVPAHEVGVRNKHNPFEDVDGSACRDGWNVEINPLPATCKVLAYKNVWNTAESLFKRLSRENPAAFTGRYNLVMIPAYLINRDRLATAPEDVMEFGCSPAQMAYLDGAAVRPEISALSHPYRYMGGHLHVGYHDYEMLSGTRYPKAAEKLLSLYAPEVYPTIVKWLDLKVGLPATYLWDRPEQYLRRQHYGKAGEYRVQVYRNQQPGLEYRVLGPEVFAHQGAHNMVLGLVQFIMTECWYKDSVPKFPEGMEEDLQRAINTGVGVEECLRSMPWMPADQNYLNLDLLKELKEKWKLKFELDTEKHHNDWGWPEWAQELLGEGKVPFDAPTRPSMAFLPFEEAVEAVQPTDIPLW